MGTDQEQKSHGGLEGLQPVLERLGVAGDADWLALVLFARNLVSSMSIFSEAQKAELQADVFKQMGRRPLDRARFLRVVGTIETFLMDNPKMADLRAQLENERRGFSRLYEEMGAALSDIRQSTQARETSLRRMDADAGRDLDQPAGSPEEVVGRLRGMITEMAAQAKAEVRAWQERAERLERTANFDALLSELYSRRALDAELSAAVERCRAGNKPLSLMFIDVDRFKDVNDSYGHQVGDGVLRVLAAILSAHALQFGGYAARFGGEELVILCEGLAEADTLARAEAIRQDVARCPFMPHLASSADGQALHVTVSIGVAQLGPGQGLSDLVFAADQAMYAAKRLGRNRVVGQNALGHLRAT